MVTFFVDKTTTQRLKINRTTINVGGNGNCGFLSVAASLIDGALSKDVHVSEPLVCILSEFSVERSTLPIQNQVLTLIRHYGFDNTLEAMALVLRRWAVAEMVKDPGKYQGPFVDIHEKTHPQDMLKPETYIDETALVALATARKMPIALSIVAGEARLPKTFVLKGKDETLTLPIISVSFDPTRKLYQPKIMNVLTFQPLQNMNMTIGNDVLLLKEESAVVPDDAVILAKIAAYNKKMSDIYEGARASFVALVDHDGSSKADLVKLYVEATTSSDYLTGYYNHASESTRRAIDNALRPYTGDVPVECYDEHVMEEIIHALSRAISIGHIPEDVIDKLKTHSTRLNQ